MKIPMPPRSKNPEITRLGPEAGGYAQIAFQLSKFYLRVLDSEAEYLGRMRRSQLLELLVLRKAGLCKFERTSTVNYSAEPNEIDELERYIWHCRTEIKNLLDGLRARMGNVPPRSWVVLALNEWIGLPSGVRDLDAGPGVGNEAPTAI